MSGDRTCARALACLLWLLSACGRETLLAAPPCDVLAPGDLVITEVHANPGGSDGDGEYIELFNASAEPLSLDGLLLATGRADGTGIKTHRFQGVSVGEGDFLVVGNAAPDSMAAHLDYSYGTSLGSLRNSDAFISIECGETLIDQMRYEGTNDGRALELDGSLEPNHELNDDADLWCPTPEGTDEFVTGNIGTPGARNSRCSPMELDGGCLEGGAVRASRPPELGQVRITEWMANPAGPDAEFEWVEVFFGEAVDLHGFQLGSSPESLEAVIAGEDCFPVDAGRRVVFGASPAATPRVDADLRFSLGNVGARSIVAGVANRVIDRVDYEGTVEGTAWQLDPAGNLCLAASDQEYATGNLGTPGAPNTICPQVLEPGTCLENGVPRKIVSPRAGEVWISEWMANPSSVGGREGEWLELRVDAEVDLNGLELSDLTSSVTRIEGENCIRAGVGAHLVFARSSDSNENGGITAVLSELSLSLNNSEETITLSVGGETLDTVSYERSTPGVATQVDDLGIRCDAVHPYGDGDLGTPGLPNPWCA